MPREARVSVVIPTWNRAATVVAAIKSALAQTLPPLEVLVCDDGSTDDTEAVVRAIGDPRVIWLPGPRGGRPAIPRNRGVAAAQGDWLAFLDSDDIWLPDKLARQFAAMARADLRAACCDAERVLPSGRDGGRLLGGATEILDVYDLLRVNRVICSSAVVHRSLLPPSPFPEILPLDEDYGCWLRVATAARFLYLAAPLVRYSDDPAHSVRGENPDGWSQRLAVLRDFRDWSRTAGASAQISVRIGREICRARVRGWIGRLRR